MYFSLEKGGMTALGPALLLAVAMASQVSGSKVSLLIYILIKIALLNECILMTLVLVSPNNSILSI